MYQAEQGSIIQDRTLVGYIMIFAQLGTLAILFFWFMGALLLLTENGGQINGLRLDSTERALFLSYPFIAVGASAAGWLLFWGRQHLLSVAFGGLPVAATALFFLTLVIFR